MSFVGQELPPQGDQPAVPYKRNIPLRGPSGRALIAGCVGIVAFGLYAYYRGLLVRGELEREKMQARVLMLPSLRQERDSRYLSALHLQQSAERQLFGGDYALPNGNRSPFYHNPHVLDAVRIIPDAGE